MSHEKTPGNRRISNRFFKSLRPLLFGCWVPFWLVGPLSILAGGGPENVLLVVNAADPSSLMIANYYQSWRGIPGRNVVYLTDIPERQVTTLEIFRERILRPILSEIEQRQLAGQIDYIVYSAGFPTAVNIGEHVKLLEKQMEGQINPAGGPNRMYNPRASINALTYFAFAVMADNPSYLTLNANWYYRDLASTLLARPFLNETQKSYEQAVNSLQSQDYDAAIEELTALAEQHPQQVAVHYQLARAWAGKQDTIRCRDSLREAVRSGWCYRDFTLADEALTAEIRTEEIQALLPKIPDEPFEFMPTRGFQFRNFWAPNGSVNGNPQQGRQYFLSAVLAVTQNLGNSELEALEQLRRSVAADSTNPQGVFAFTLTNDVRTRARQSSFAAAIDRLKALGHEAEVVTNVLPNRGPLAGVSIGTANFNWPQARLELVPGAIAENFTSFGGVMERTGQTKLSEFIRLGAAGSSGTVIEPLAIPNKFPHPMIHVHYVRGCSLAEAFYQSVASPFQLLIVGDPLCRPWATLPTFEIVDWESDYPLSGNVEFNAKVKPNSAPIAGYEIYIDQRLITRQAELTKFAFDTRQFADGFHEMRIIAIANTHLRHTGQQILPFAVDNQSRAVKFVGAPTEPISIDTPVKIRVEATWGQKILIYHNLREIAQVDGQAGEVVIDPRVLGRGPVVLQAIAQAPQSPQESAQPEANIASPPLYLEIKGPIGKEIPLREPALLNPQPKK